MVEQRKARRFELKLPVELIRAGAVPIGGSGETQNLSSAGVLMTTGHPVKVGDPVEYLITLPVPGNGDHAVRLHCMGKVVRQEVTAAAATLERYEFVRG